MQLRGLYCTIDSTKVTHKHVYCIKFSLQQKQNHDLNGVTNFLKNHQPRPVSRISPDAPLQLATLTSGYISDLASTNESILDKSVDCYHIYTSFYSHIPRVFWVSQ